MFFFAIFGYEISSTFVSLYLAKKGTSFLKIGSIISLWPLFVIFFSPVSGYLSDRKGRKFFIALGAFLYFVFGFLCFLEQFHLAYLLLGVGNAFLWTAGRAYVLDMAKGKKAKESSRFFASAVLGSILGAPFSGFIVQNIGFKQAFLFGSIFSGISVAFAFLLKDKRKTPAKKFLPRESVLARNPFLLFISVAIISFLPVATKIYLPILADSIGIGAFLIGLIFLISKVSVFCSQFLGAKIYEKYEEKISIAFSSGTNSLSFLIIYFAVNFPQLAFASILGGFGYGIGFLTCQTYLSKLTKAYGFGSGIFEIFVNLGQFLVQAELLS